jgi:hypothetical protein
MMRTASECGEKGVGKLGGCSHNQGSISSICSGSGGEKSGVIYRGLATSEQDGLGKSPRTHDERAGKAHNTRLLVSDANNMIGIDAAAKLERR